MECSAAVERVDRRLADAGFSAERSTLAGREALVARRADFRFKWIATKLHTFVVVFVVPALSEELAEGLTAAAQQHAIKSKGGLPRGLQTGTATVPVFLTGSAQAAVLSWFSAEPKHRYGALRFPVLAQLSDGTLTYFQGRTMKGAVYLAHLHSIVEDVVGPAVKRAA